MTQILQKIALCAFGITARPRDVRPQWLVCPTFGMFILSFFYRQFYLSPFYFDLYFHFKFLCELLDELLSIDQILSWWLVLYKTEDYQKSKKFIIEEKYWRGYFEKQLHSNLWIVGGANKKSRIFNFVV